MYNRLICGFFVSLGVLLWFSFAVGAEQFVHESEATAVVVDEALVMVVVAACTTIEGNPMHWSGYVVTRVNEQAVDLTE